MHFTAKLFFCVSLVLFTPAWASDPKPFPEFTFKREKPPKPGTRKLITIQIEPQDQNPATSAGAASEETTTTAGTAHYDWYWEKVPAELNTDPAVRMRLAFDTLGNGSEGEAVREPRLQTLQTIAASVGVNILRATIGTDVSPALVLAVISVESGGRTDAVSGKGAQGLMQLMPATAERFGADNSLDTDQNIRAGVAYLNWLLQEFDGDAVLALAGYNAGENAVKSHNGVPPFAETRDYVPKVLAAFRVARALCKTQPELITDACALNLALN